jgi:hypothetical protein
MWKVPGLPLHFTRKTALFPPLRKAPRLEKGLLLSRSRVEPKESSPCENWFRSLFWYSSSLPTLLHHQLSRNPQWFRNRAFSPCSEADWSASQLLFDAALANRFFFGTFGIPSVFDLRPNISFGLHNSGRSFSRSGSRPSATASATTSKKYL